MHTELLFHQKEWLELEKKKNEKEDASLAHMLKKGDMEREIRRLKQQDKDMERTVALRIATLDSGKKNEADWAIVEQGMHFVCVDCPNSINLSNRSIDQSIIRPLNAYVFSELFFSNGKRRNGSETVWTADCQLSRRKSRNAKAKCRVTEQSLRRRRKS